MFIYITRKTAQILTPFNGQHMFKTHTTTKLHATGPFNDGSDNSFDQLMVTSKTSNYRWS